MNDLYAGAFAHGAQNAFSQSFAPTWLGSTPAADVPATRLEAWIERFVEQGQDSTSAIARAREVIATLDAEAEKSRAEMAQRVAAVNKASAERAAERMAIRASVLDELRATATALGLPKRHWWKVLS